TAKAFIAINARRPALADIGFIWPPLDTMTIYPFAMIKPLAMADALASNISTAVIGAINVLLVYRILCRMGMANRWSTLGAICYGLNPQVLFYAANGMAESCFILGLLVAAWSFLSWLESGRFTALMVMALGTAWAIMTRYEAGALAIFFCVAIIIRRLREEPPRIEASLLAYAGPVAYSVLLWCYFNWLILGNPFYFLSSPLAAVGLVTSVESQVLRGTLPDGLGKLAFVFVYTAALYLPLLALVPFLFVRAWRRRDSIPALMVALSLVLPAIMYVMIYLNKLAVQPRYFMPIIPMAVLLTGMAWRELNEDSTSHRLGRLALVLSFLITPYLTSVWIWNYTIGEQQDRTALHMMLTGDAAPGQPGRPLAEHIAAMPKDVRILTDELTTYDIVMLSGDPKKFALEVDDDYQKVLAEPSGRVTHILAWTPRGEKGTLDAVNRRFPELFDKGASFAELEYELIVKPDQGWRLYRLTGPIQPDETTPAPGDKTAPGAGATPGTSATTPGAPPAIATPRPFFTPTPYANPRP
ncbi:MAG: glycosyltransferase family 39 protein, partial [Chloroflexi bacterium]|nr:glycosyltransferase family 39 protein [Chloroflexota bacterium]